MKLSKEQKTRMISLLIIVIFLFLYCTLFILGIKNTMIKTEPSETFYIDGTDFTLFADLATAATNLMLSIIETGVSLVILAFICIILLLAWRSITIQEDSMIEQSELFVTKVMLITYALSTLIAGLTVTGLFFLPAILAHMLVSCVLCIIFAYLPLKKAYKSRFTESP